MSDLSIIHTVVLASAVLAAQRLPAQAGDSTTDAHAVRVTQAERGSALLVHADAGARGVLVLGLSNERWGELALPLALDPLGLPGCRLYVSPNMLVPFVTDAGGTAIVSLPARVSSTTLHAQAFVVANGSGSSANAAVGPRGSDPLHLAPSAPRPADVLPVFRLSAPKVSRAQVDALLANMTGNVGITTTNDLDRPGTVGRQAGTKEVEVYVASGGVFARDTAKLWNPNITPTLPSEGEARSAADRFLATNRLLPTADGRVDVTFSSFSETGAAVDLPGPVTKTVLDRQVNYDAHVVIEREGKRASLPVVGGGGNFKVAIGESSEIVGYHGVWRPIAGVASYERIVSKEDVEASYRAQARDLDLRSVEASLAYYSAPAIEQQAFLVPVWVIRATANFNGVVSPISALDLRDART